jgi:hypothetical protein
LVMDTNKLAAMRNKAAEKTLDGSKHISDRSVIETFTSNPDHTFLVSFPRTGSHWLRMIMELYFQRPSLVRVFFYPDHTDYLTLHTHDLDLSVERRSVIYLYREPVATIFSQLSYYKEDINDTTRIRHWATLYGKHLAKWLIQEQFTIRKTIVNYDRMTANMDSEFLKVCFHFGESLDQERLRQALAQVSKYKLKQKTPHDQQVVDLSQAYTERKALFMAKHTDVILEQVYAQHSGLKRIL